MTPIYEDVMTEIEEFRHAALEWADIYGWDDEESDSQENDEYLDYLNLKAQVYRAIGESKSSKDGEDFNRNLDALYVFTRRYVPFEATLILGSEDTLPTDNFGRGLFYFFSVAQWWYDVSGEKSTELHDFNTNDEMLWSGYVCIETGMAIRRVEASINGVRGQSFVANYEFDNTILILVLRQWVELASDDNKDNLRVSLAKNERWQHLVSPEGALRWHQGEGQEYVDGWAKEALQKAGLPYTPSMQKYLEQERDKNCAELRNLHGLPPKILPDTIVVPRRGGMVTTFVFRKCHENQIYCLQQTLAPPTGRDLNLSNEFDIEASKIKAAHMEWIQHLDLGILERLNTKGPQRKDDPINRDIALGLSRSAVVTNHISRLENFYGKRGLPVPAYAREDERRKASQRCRDQNIS